MNIFDISILTANRIYNIANIALILGALFILCGTIAAIWTGGIKERYAEDRISINERDTALAKAEAAKANLASLVLQKQLAWRTLDQAQRGRIIAAVRPFPPQKYFLNITIGPDTRDFFNVIKNVLASAGWSKLPAPRGNINGLSDIIDTDLDASLDTASGILVKYAPSRAAVLKPMADRFVISLEAEGISASLKADPDCESHPDNLTIVVGTK